MANFVSCFEKWGRRRCRFRPSWHYPTGCLLPWAEIQQLQFSPLWLHASMESDPNDLLIQLLLLLHSMLRANCHIIKKPHYFVTQPMMQCWPNCTELRFSQSTKKMGQMGLIGSAVWLVAPKRPPRILIFSTAMGVKPSHLYEIRCYLETISIAT